MPNQYQAEHDPIEWNNGIYGASMQEIFELC